MFLLLAAAAIATKHISYVSGHASIFHPAMWGFNVTDQTFPYDNRAVAPLMDMTFDQWWFHGHLDYPPHAEDVFELPAGSNVTTEIGCNKGATSYFASSEGGDIRSGDDVCPGSDISEYHTTGIDDVKGCALAIAYKSNVSDVQPEDFTVFSVNQTCVWTRFTDFSVPQRMPPCPDGGCICAWFWIHSPDSGGEQNYMTGFQCNVTNSVSTTPLAPAQVARRCGADPTANKVDPVIGNCTYGAKMPHYWYQKERNTMFEGTYAPPFYTDLYNFLDGPQDDIFADSYHNDSMPQPSENQTALPVLKTVIQGQKFRVPDAAQVLSNNSLLALIQQAEASASTFIASATVGAASVQASSTEAVQSATSGAPASSSALPSVSTSVATAIPTSVTTSIETTTVTETEIQTQTVVVILAATSTAAPAGTTMFLNSIDPSLSATADASASTASGNGNGNGTAFASMNGELNSMVNAVNMTSAADTSNVELVSVCKRSDPSEPQSSTTSPTAEHYSFPRTWASRLGMGTYERKRSMHSRTGGVEALWGLGLW